MPVYEEHVNVLQERKIRLKLNLDFQVIAADFLNWDFFNKTQGISLFSRYLWLIFQMATYLMNVIFPTILSRHPGVLFKMQILMSNFSYLSPMTCSLFMGICGHLMLRPLNQTTPLDDAIKS